MTLWDDVPSDLRSGGALDGLRPVLDTVATPAATERVEEDGRSWRVYTTALGDTQPLLVDPATGAFTRGSPASTPIEFPDPSLDLELALRLDAPAGSPDGTVRLIVATPSAVVRLPFLRGAALDAQGQLRADPGNPDVRFLLPELRVRFLRPADAGVSVDLLSAATGPAVD